jgi:Asp-tRNA(Asn)/Glu-tRNA(Gln) amidotransferase A subunit family amidase
MRRTGAHSRQKALPLGVQFVGPYRGDSTVLLAADAAWKTISR